LKKSDERATVAKKRNVISKLLKEVVAKADRHDPSIHYHVARFEARYVVDLFLNQGLFRPATF
jgi:hypothetical protein